MAKAKVKKKNNFWVDGIISIFFSFVLGYIVLKIFEFFKTDNSKSILRIFDGILDFKSGFEFLFGLSFQEKIYALFIFLIIFISMILFLRIDKFKGFEDAAWHGVHGDARFYSVSEMIDRGFAAPVKESKYSTKDYNVALSAKEGIILGLDEKNKNMLIVPLSTELTNQNVLVVGESGSAKGQAFVIPNILNQRTSSMIVSDPKGELYHLTGDIKRDQGYKVVQVDFVNLTGNKYNPLEYINDDLDAKRVAYTIAKNSAKEDKEDHWFVKAWDLLTGLIIYCKDKYDNPSIPIEVKREFNKIAEDEAYLLEIIEEIGMDHEAYSYLKDAAVAKGNERASILSTFTKQTGIFNSAKVRNMTSENTFHFSDLQEQPTIIYVKIPIKDNPVAALTATFFDQAISYLYKYADANESVLKRPTKLLLDEFANIGKLNGYDETLQTCRGLLLSIITILQDFAQVEAKYGKELTRTIINAHASKILLKTSDTETAKYFEEIAGTTTVKYDTKSVGTGGGWAYILDLDKNSKGSVSKSEHFQKINLLDKSVLYSIPKSDAYVFMDGKVIPVSKSFQHNIYGNFITESYRVGEETKFKYVYPNHRSKYIKDFGFVPYNQTIKISSEIQKKDISDISLKAEIHSKEEEKSTDTVIVPEIKSEKLDSLLDAFFVNDFSGKKQEAAPVIKTKEKTPDVEAIRPKKKKEITIKDTIESIKENIMKKHDDGSVETVAALKDIKALDAIQEQSEKIEQSSIKIQKMTQLKMNLDAYGSTNVESVDTNEDAEAKEDITEIEDIEVIEDDKEPVTSNKYTVESVDDEQREIEELPF